VVFRLWERPPPVRRLMEVNAEIEQREKELNDLYIERDRLAWALEDGDHTE
jgi:hypothetical protein